LTGGSVRVGISNPNTDPAGYRGWLVLEAAGGRYANRSDFFSNRLLKAEANVTGFSAAELIAPLESGQIQFLLIYKSACISHGLNFIQLPKSVNLGDAGYSGFYSRFDYKLARGPVKGAPVLLFVTVPVDCVDCGDSVKLVSYVVKNSGSLSRFGLQILNPSKLYNNTEVPPLISDLLSEGLLESSGPP
jgi:molybdate/tungstate transport system substrate-binding protein